MTQQEINAYFIGAGYTETEPNTFLDSTGEFTFVTDEEQLEMLYPDYTAVILNSFISDVAFLENWIQLQEYEAKHPPQL